MVFLPLYVLVMNWVYLWGFTIIRLNTFMDLRTLDVYLVWDTRGGNGMFYWFTWCMFWHSARGFPRWHWGNLCIGVAACFHPCFFDRNLGALFDVLCVGLNIMNLKLFDAYRIIDPRILVVTLEYLCDIRVDWCVFIWCYSSTNSRAVCDTYRNSSKDWSKRINLMWFLTV